MFSFGNYLITVEILIDIYFRQIENQEIAEENELAGEEIKTPYEEASLAITPTFVAIFVLCMCGMLVLLYFFYKYLGN